MRKILLASNAHDIKNAAVDFGCYIANLTNSSLNGILLESVHQQQMAEALVTVSDKEYVTMLPQNIAASADSFCARCLRNEARHTVHHLYGNPLQNIIKESLYADIIVADGNTSFNTHEGWPSVFVKDLLEHARCPVIITPFDFEELNEIVFAYDGSYSSVFAMKQFIYLFPELRDVKITVLQVSKDDNSITEFEKLKSLLMMYYGAVHYDLVHGDADSELFKRFLIQRNKMLVMGAYGRKKMLTKSTADILLKTLNMPIFITHH